MRISSDLALSVRGLTKEYRIGSPRPMYRTLRDHLSGGVRRFANQLRGGGAAGERLRALDDVTFDVRKGETVGIVGANGAGKSTLLKILSRITQPTRGEAALRGRVGSLLEVGTGFHPELTGRENVFLNGAILGMPRAEVARKFDAIVAFAGVERFLDTAVRFYSTGMYVRLAFAVAAHLEPDILIIDEVLAVGDAEFQRRCLDRLSAVARDGRTVVFVSHNLEAVQRLCTRGLLLRDGRLAADGTARDVVTGYRALAGVGDGLGRFQSAHRTGSGWARFMDVRLMNQDARTGLRRCDEDLEFEFDLAGSPLTGGSRIQITVLTPEGTPLCTIASAAGAQLMTGPAATVQLRVSAPTFVPGIYRARVALVGPDGQPVDVVDDALEFEIVAPAGGGADAWLEGAGAHIVREGQWRVARERIGMLAC